MASTVPGASTLLSAQEPFPTGYVNRKARSQFLLIGDHAGNAVPLALGDLGVSEADRTRHIGWDIGVRGLGERLAAALDAPFVHQHYSRLVIDCNRDPERADAVPEVSDGTPIPGNVALSAADRAARVAAIHEPYQVAIQAALTRQDQPPFVLSEVEAQGHGSAHALRLRSGRTVGGGKAPIPATVLVALHSFTPRLATGEPRPWQAGVLHDLGDTRFALAALAALREEAGLTVGDNEPYQMDGTDHTIPRHAYPARRYVEFEVRQDLIADAAGQAEWAERLALVLTTALAVTPIP